MVRLRDLGIIPGSLPSGQHNAITDVAGVKIGHVTLISGSGKLVPGEGPVRTGVTAIVPHPGNIFREKVPAAVLTINGFGKACGFEQVRELGTLETPVLLTNTLNVGRAADGLVGYMLRENDDLGLSLAGTVNPVVGETNDGFLNDIRGRHVQQAHIWQALDDAADGPVAEGNVGAGTGTACFQFKGGIGTASRVVLDGRYTVGALVQTNYGLRAELMVCGVPVGRHLQGRYLPETGPGSIMMVIATDAPLTAQQLGRLTMRAAFGLARTGSTCQHGSGDFVIAFSTANRQPYLSDAVVEDIQRVRDGRPLDALFGGVIEAVEEAILNSLVAAETMTGRDGNTLHALPHDQLVDLMRYYRRLD